MFISHCFFISNCVGLRNHKFFYLFVLYGTIGAAYIAILNIIHVFYVFFFYEIKIFACVRCVKRKLQILLDVAYGGQSIGECGRRVGSNPIASPSKFKS